MKEPSHEDWELEQPLTNQFPNSQRGVWTHKDHANHHITIRKLGESPGAIDQGVANKYVVQYDNAGSYIFGEQEYYDKAQDAYNRASDLMSKYSDGIHYDTTS